MTTEYSRDVEDWQDSNWDHVGVDAMYHFYLNDKEAKREAKDCDMDIEDYAREKSEESYPMMLYCYPLAFDPSDEKIIEVCKRTACTVVMDNQTDDYYLALAGGGMDLSQDIALAYLITDGYIPHSLAMNINKQHCLSVGGKDYLKIAKEIKRQLKIEISRCKSDIKSWEEHVKQYRERERQRIERGKLEKEEA